MLCLLGELIKGRKKLATKTALDILKNADWEPFSTPKGTHGYIRANYKGNQVSIRDDSHDLIVKRNGKIVKRYYVGGTDEYESLFPLFWGGGV